MDKQRKSQFFFTLFLVGSVLLILHAWYYYPFIADDSFISYRYAERLLEGKGLSWNAGKPVEGYSNLLWILLLAALEKITHTEWWILALMVGLICSLVTLYLLMAFINRLSRGEPVSLVMGTMSFVLSSPVAVWINGGLEAPLVMLLLWIAVTLLLKEGVKYKNFILAGVCLGLLSVTRPDGLLFTLAISVALPFYFGTRDQKVYFIPILKPLLLLNGIALIFYLAQLIFRLSYYGEWIPNTALVKIGFTFNRIREGWQYTGRMLLVYIPFIIVSLFLLRGMERKYTAVIRFLLIIVLVDSVYTTGIGGDIFPGFRFAVPLVPLLSVVVAFSMIEATGRIPLLRTKRFQYIAAGTACLFIFVLQNRLYINRITREEDWEWNCMAIGKALRKGFAPDQPSVATTAAGALPFYSRLPTLDMLGLNDYYLAHHRPADFGTGYLAHELGDPEYYMQQKPDIVIFSGDYFNTPSFRPELELFNREDFRRAYQAVRMKYRLDYQLFFPVYKKTHRSKTAPDQFTLLYIRKQGIAGIGVAGQQSSAIPAYLLRNGSRPDSATTTFLDSAGRFAIALSPQEAYFIPDDICREIRSPEENRNLNFRAPAVSGDSLSVIRRNGLTWIYNPYNKTEELTRLQIIR
jgi:arabinofuranosyltransferase